MIADHFEPCAINPDWAPFYANHAITSLQFDTRHSRQLVEQTIPSLRVRSVEWQSLFAYPMSGGFQSWSLIPAALVGPMLALEKRMPDPVRKHLAFRMMVVLERVQG